VPATTTVERMEIWVRSRPGRTGYRRDLFLALGLALGAGLSAMLYARVGIYSDPAPLWVTTVTILALTLPLALRRRFPATVALVVSAAFFAAGQLQVPEGLVTSIALFIAIYSLGAWGADRRLANVIRAVITAGMFLWIFVNLVLTALDPELLPNFSRSGIFSQLAAWSVIQVVTNLLYFVGAWVFGNAMWSSARQRAKLKSQAEELAAEREFSASQAVALDRVRIARELHDVVAHHVSVMGVQAGASRRVIATDPVQAAESLGVIEKSARSAVEELHKLLTTLRDGDADPASTSSSTRGVAQLDELVAAAGVPAELHLVGDPRPLTALIGFTIYRIAQEGLTNVRKHAGPRATVDVRLRYSDELVELEIADTGTVSSGPKKPGLGQQGMRERIAAVGGAIEFGAISRGGYLVRASIPTGTP